MRAVVPPVSTRAIAMSSAQTIEPISADSPLQVFCRLQVGQVLSQLPDAGIRLVYQSPDQSKRQSFVFGRERWSILDAESRTYLASEAWWTKNPIGCLKKVRVKSPGRFYVCSLSQTKPEYLLIATTKLLTTDQKRFIENTATLLNHHLSTVRELHRQRQTQQQIEHNNHQIEHQVKSPIALIQIYTEMLLSTVPERQARSYLESIQSSIQDIHRHLKQLSAQQKPLRIEPHDLSQILTRSINQLQPWLTEKQITVHYSRSPMLLDVDAWQLKQVFDNLITNAIYFSPDRSTIYCTWQIVQQEILIEVSDQGAGLSEADLEQVFMPFYSRRPEGTGLGLSIAQKIIQAHQGRIWVSNLPTGGAKFSLTLPRQQPKLSIVPAL
ncbi:HAMP domain-containing sensor histidine kinase [Leptolyngbya sp. FACHB-17]|uniref:sensor histidine kinase n=1 Tax=unclassified Leptolyngbya TaxID=2650499 RepID=UPI00168045E2|nr:HAMP domain-containing sensor histidine kinase [Leptolyngbya sp. FACHB-17]MBD2079605.1 HAMP domain-containing histidine kinase [Leptolyngbya sp. FACHB-17]